MMRTLRPFGACLVVLFTLAACSGAGTGTGGGPGTKQTFGALGGAALGGLAGAQIGGGSGQLAATAAGALLGGLLGSEVGVSLDRADQVYMQRTTAFSLEQNRVGQTSTWQNPDTGRSGTVTPVRTFESAAGQPCRDFRQTVEIDGQTEIAEGTACRTADGTWRIVQ